MTVFEISVSLSDCVSTQGFFGDSSVSFQAFAPGSYALTISLASCVPCPSGVTSPACDSSQQDCTCSLEGWQSAVSPETGFCDCLPGFASDGSCWCQPCTVCSYCTAGDTPPSVCFGSCMVPGCPGAVANKRTFCMTLLVVLNPFFGGGGAREFSIQIEINCFHTTCTIDLTRNQCFSPRGNVC